MNGRRDAFSTSSQFARRVSARARASVRRAPLEPTVPPQPQGPRAVYARVLDGESLWLALASDPGPLALRHRATGTLMHLDNDAPPDPTYTSLLWRLTDLDGDEEATYDLVTDAGVPVLGGPTKAFPMRTPPTHDRRWLYELTSEAGALVVRRTRPKRAVEITHVTLEEGRVRLWLTPAPDQSRLRLTASTGRTLIESATDADAPDAPIELELRDGSAWIAADDVPDTGAGQEGTWLLDIVHGDQLIALVRRHDECAQPGRSTALPTLWGDAEGGGRSTIRLTYGPDSRVRVIREPADASFDIAPIRAATDDSGAVR